MTNFNIKQCRGIISRIWSFVTVNETDGKGRKLANIIRIRAIWHEEDTPCGKDFPLEPHLIIESSPGKFHRYWLVGDLSQTNFSGIMERMIRDYGSDPNVKDTSRVLRLPGFYHQKDPGQPFIVRIVSESGCQPYSAEQILAAFPPILTAQMVDESKAVDNRTDGAAKALVAELASRAARRTQEDPRKGRHTQILWLGFECAQRGVAIDYADYAVKIFANLMRQTDTTGKAEKINFDSEVTAFKKSFAKGLKAQPAHSHYVAQAQIPIEAYEADFAKLNPVPAYMPGNDKITRFKLLNDAELLALPPLQWVIRDVLPASGLAAVWGPSGSGKSLLVLDMALAMASGQDWFGYRIKKPVKVVYCALEGESGISGRVKAHHKRYECNVENIKYLLESFDLRKPGDVGQLIISIKEQGFDGGVIILDTLNRAAPGSDENSSKDMGDIISGGKVIQDALGGLILLVHHSGKDATKGERGHSSLRAALDSSIEVKRNGTRSWVNSKVKDGPDGTEHNFNLDIVLIGHDEDGDELTSCVIVDEGRKQRKKPLTARNEVIFSCLGDAIMAYGIEPLKAIKKKYGGFDKNKKIAKIEQWREISYTVIALTTADIDIKTPKQISDAKNKAFNRARTALFNAGRIIEHGEFAWIVD